MAAAVVGLAALSAGPASADEGNLSFVECLEDTGSTAACRDAVGNDGLSGTAGVIVSPDGEHTYVASGIDSTVSVFARNINTGKLDFIEVHKDGVAGVDGLADARDIDMSPDGRSVYVTGSLDSAVAAFSRNPRTGRLTFIEFEKNGVGGVDGIDSANGVTVSPDGKQVYVTGFRDDAIATFARDRATGALTFVRCLGDTPVGTPLSTCPSTGGIDGIKSA